jgi:hypothetical protein
LRPKWKGIKALHTDFPPQWNRHSRLGGPTGVALTSPGYAGPRLPEGIWAAPPIRAPEGFIEGNTPRLLPVRPALPLHLPLCGPSQLLIVPHQPPNLSNLPTLFGSARSQCRGRHLRQLGIADAGLGRCCTGRQHNHHPTLGGRSGQPRATADASRDLARSPGQRAVNRPWDYFAEADSAGLPKTLRQPSLKLARCLCMQAVIRSTSGISDEQRRKTSPVQSRR